MPEPDEALEKLTEGMKRASATLRDAGIRHALAGGLAAWARGGPGTDHDVDFLVKPEDAERAWEALGEAGMRTERPPEPWLLKAYYEDDVLIDLIFDPAGGPVTDDVLDRAEDLEVMAMRLPVASLEDVMITKLMALTEQEPEFGGVLEMARSVREQIDWALVRERTKDSPFAKAFFVLAEELGIVRNGPGRGQTVD